LEITNYRSVILMKIYVYHKGLKILAISKSNKEFPELEITEINSEVELTNLEVEAKFFEIKGE